MLPSVEEHLNQDSSHSLVNYRGFLFCKQNLICLLFVVEEQEKSYDENGDDSQSDQ